MTKLARNLVVIMSVSFTVAVLLGISRARSRQQASALAGEDPPSVDPPRPPAPDPRPPVLPVPAPRGEAVVSGRLVDDETGQPIAGAEVKFRAESRTLGLAAPVTSVATSDRLGAFLVPGLPSGVYVRMRVEKEGYPPDVVEARVPRGDASLDVGTVRMMKVDWKRKIEGGPRGLVGLEHELREGKVVITGVRPQTPAERAGIRRGEAIVSEFLAILEAYVERHYGSTEDNHAHA